MLQWKKAVAWADALCVLFGGLLILVKGARAYSGTACWLGVRLKCHNSWMG